MISRFSVAETDYAAVVVALLLGCALWLASLSGLFSTLYGVLYDHLLGRSGASASQQPRVLLLEVEPELREAGDEVWLPLIRELQAQGAAQLVFTFAPPGVSGNFYFMIQNIREYLWIIIRPFVCLDTWDLRDSCGLSDHPLMTPLQIGQSRFESGVASSSISSGTSRLRVLLEQIPTLPLSAA